MSFLLPDRGSCARCGKTVPDSAFGPFTRVGGLPFGRCPKCDQIWCYDCAEKDRGSYIVYYTCPQCHAELSSRLASVKTSRKASGLCVMCGNRLTFVQKLLGRDRHAGCTSFKA